MKSLTSVALFACVFLLASCSSNQKKHVAKGEGHHHHVKKEVEYCDKKSCSLGQCQMYEKHCALSVSHGDMHVKGKDEYKLTHKGHTYYFSSEEKKKEFQKGVDENIKAANKNWNAFKWQQIR